MDDDLFAADLPENTAILEDSDRGRFDLAVHRTADGDLVIRLELALCNKTGAKSRGR